MKLSIKKTKTGKGVFADQAIRKGAVIQEMSGKVKSSSEIEELITAGKIALDDPFQVSEDKFIVLDKLPRYFNHHCEPNAGIGEGNMLFALRDITKGEQIAFDYSTTVCTHCDWRMACACGSKTCRKIITNAKSIPKKKLQEYVQFGAVPVFIRKELKIAKSK